MGTILWDKEKGQGFSIVELMIVIAVIAIMAATAVPGITSWLPNYRLKSAARGVYSQFQMAKLQAVRTDAECVVFFDQANNICEVVSGGPDGVFDGNPVPQNDDVVLSRFFLNGYGSNVTFGSGNAAQKVAGGAFGPDPWDYNFTFALFNDRGMVFDQGYVYITNNEGGSYAVGTPTFAGFIELRKWYDNGVWE